LTGLGAVALTQGDPAGIGPEIAIQAWLRRDEARLPPFFALTDPGLLEARARMLGAPCPVEATTPEEAAAVFSRALPVVPLTRAVAATPGAPDSRGAASAIEAIETAVALVRAGRAAALTTNPIAKHVLYEAGFRHPGHTEFLAALAADPPPRPVMMLWSEGLAVVPVTVHIPLGDVPAALTQEAVVETGLIVARALRERFGVAAPRLAVAGLNPHAGENGTMGREDEAVVRPAVDRLRASGVDARGPLPADTMFHARARQGYDAALAMYHDQALIPIKSIAFDDAVNVTLGLPFVRTSPDHGTAFDIAGRGLARPDSLIAALRLASRLSGP